jgi:hypothetical protein
MATQAKEGGASPANAAAATPPVSRWKLSRGELIVSLLATLLLCCSIDWILVDAPEWDAREHLVLWVLVVALWLALREVWRGLCALRRRRPDSSSASSVRRALPWLCLLLIASCTRFGGPGSAPPKLVGRETGREFLLAGQSEAPGYGLYSYLLFGERPGAESRARYASVLEAFLRIPDAQELQRDGSQPWQLNITYLLLETAAPVALRDLHRTDPPIDMQSAVDWILQHYDYARARRILASMPGEHLSGPYLVSSKVPWSARTMDSPCLWQDLSSITPRLASVWMVEFRRQAAKERYWQRPDDLRAWALELRQAIARVAPNAGLLEKMIKIATSG